ncbi:uncharacterized protein B0H64DRAFT_157641 [Chaetomium fimeti]|uniref:Uncharacterized protein n=1 Tax=Chaetomium fimeti TaxID=1854472 RepID=A0AAE0LSH4_9PEZI|nr:hypothetical protein B0H64DRAFT_157641 [Chaetomium fimeti]
MFHADHHTQVGDQSPAFPPAGTAGSILRSVIGRCRVSIRAAGSAELVTPPFERPHGSALVSASFSPLSFLRPDVCWGLGLVGHEPLHRCPLYDMDERGPLQRRTCNDIHFAGEGEANTRLALGVLKHRLVPPNAAVRFARSSATARIQTLARRGVSPAIAPYRGFGDLDWGHGPAHVPRAGRHAAIDFEFSRSLCRVSQPRDKQRCHWCARGCVTVGEPRRGRPRVQCNKTSRRTGESSWGPSERRPRNFQHFILAAPNAKTKNAIAEFLSFTPGEDFLRSPNSPYSDAPLQPVVVHKELSAAKGETRCPHGGSPRAAWVPTSWL